MSAALDKLKNEIASREQTGRKPKGVLVSPDLYTEMRQAGLIDKKMATPGGLDLPDWGLDLPFYEEVYVHVDPELGAPYHLPAKP
jgi:hypothetical protein